MPLVIDFSVKNLDKKIATGVYVLQCLLSFHLQDITQAARKETSKRVPECIKSSSAR